MTGGRGHVDQADDDWVRRTAWGLPARVVPMPEQPSLRPVCIGAHQVSPCRGASHRTLT
jgi:hypothetical protein